MKKEGERKIILLEVVLLVLLIFLLILLINGNMTGKAVYSSSFENAYSCPANMVIVNYSCDGPCYSSADSVVCRSLPAGVNVSDDISTRRVNTEVAENVSCPAGYIAYGFDCGGDCSGSSMRFRCIKLVNASFGQQYSTGFTTRNHDCGDGYATGFDCGAGCDSRTMSLKCINVAFSGASAGSCSIKCASRQSGVYNPEIITAPTEIIFGNTEIIGINSNNIPPLNYEFWWKYYFTDGTWNESCSCGSGSSMDNNWMRLNSGTLSVTSYNLGFLFNNSFGKLLKNVTLKTAALKAGNRSGWVSWDINVNYPCTSDCDIKNKKYPVPGDNRKYRTCAEVSGGCLKLGENITCPAGNVFESATGNCIGAGITYSCFGNEASSGNEKFCSTAIILANARALSGDSCSLAGLKCFACDGGFHLYGNNENDRICVNNTCQGRMPMIVNGTLIGRNNFSSGQALSWLYSRTTTLSSICKWKCLEGYHKVINETFVGCEIGFDICSEISLVGCLNSTSTLPANISLINGTCSIGYSCYDCINGLSWNGSQCVLCSNTCLLGGGFCSDVQIENSQINSSLSCCSQTLSCYKCSDGKIFGNGVCREPCASGFAWNGSLCICSNGCTYNNACLSAGLRLLIGGQRLFCNSSGSLQQQKPEGTNCASNSECQSNSCSINTGKCVSLISEIQETRGLLTRVLCWFRKLFGSAETCS